MDLTKYYTILDLQQGADLAAVKRAYRRLAFALHPDLNPEVPDASRRFQQLNEAYVILTQKLSAKPSGRTSFSSGANSDREAGAKAREEANKAYAKAKAGERRDAGPGKDKTEFSKEDVVRDLLNDPFAKRVFEDIYSHIRHQSEEEEAERQAAASSGRAGQKPPPPSWNNRRKSKTPPHTPPGTGKVLSKVSGWLRKQIDDEQVIYLPSESLIPGARVRLDIQHGLMGKSQAVELTLPSGFEPGKAIRLKGMGKRIGGWKGDLYVKLEPKPA